MTAPEPKCGPATEAAPSWEGPGETLPPVVEAAFVGPELVEAAYRPVEALAGSLIETEAAAPDPGVALRRLVARLGQAGLLRLVVPGAAGGRFSEVSFCALSLARERLARLSPLADLAFAMQGLGGHPLVLGATPAARDAYLSPLVAGTAVAAFALTEPEAGSDLSGIATRAEPVPGGDEVRLTGEKVWISNAGLADVYTVFAVRGDAEPGLPLKARLSAFVVPADAPGLTARPMAVLGGHPIGRLTLDGVQVPAEGRLGAAGDGLRLALATLGKFRVTVGAAAVGLAQRALEETVQHVHARRQFGAPLAALPAVQLRLAEMASDLEASRLLVYRAAEAIDRGAPREVLARTGSMAKLVATEAAQRVVDHAVQLHGGLGVAQGHPVARLYEEVRALRIYEGTTDVQKTLVAREVLKGTPPPPAGQAGPSDG